MKPILIAQSLPFASGVSVRTPEAEIGFIGRNTERICLPQDFRGRIELFLKSASLLRQSPVVNHL